MLLGAKPAPRAPKRHLPGPARRNKTATKRCLPVPLPSCAIPKILLLSDGYNALSCSLHENRLASLLKTSE